jgi:hypothetical protein
MVQGPPTTAKEQGNFSFGIRQSLSENLEPLNLEL